MRSLHCMPCSTRARNSAAQFFGAILRRRSLSLVRRSLSLVARNSPNGNISRLGVPEYDWGGNCIHGVQSRCAADGRCPTSYPNPNALGATFNKTVWRKMGSVIGVELRSLWLQGLGENHASGLPHIGVTQRA